MTNRCLVTVMVCVFYSYSSYALAARITTNDIDRIVERSYRFTVLVNSRVFIGLGGDQKTTATSPYFGTGMVIDTKQGLILTNRHVVTKSPAEIHIIFHNKEKVPARRVYLDDRMDIAILQVNPKDVKFDWLEATFQIGEPIRPGHEVLAFGHPLGYEFSISRGSISSQVRKEVGYGRFYQADLSIAAGNSGGPLISLRTGNVLGMNTYRSAQDGSKLTFALAADDFWDIVQEVRKKGKVEEIKRGEVGTKFVKISDKRLNLYLKDVPRPPGLFSKGMYVVTSVTRGGAGDRAGLKAFDVIYQVGPYLTMEDTIDIANRYVDMHVGKSVPVVLVRDGKLINVTLEIENNAKYQVKDYVLVSGVAVHDVNPDSPGFAISDQMGVEVTDILDDAPGDRGDLKRFDVIKAVNGTFFRNKQDFLALLKAVKPGTKAEVLYQRFGQQYNVEFGLSELEVLHPPLLLGVDDPLPR